ncbi:MAG TPA: Gmad2 immunoglobulin-like domain-containing protein [Candidatus Dojkabacteria bacterium]|nr:Gmad2 immunoglobulin-like domain-containing protein [Candidatus Dojkabacteria bacterium]HRO64741.1 Gmad2 immunoglobulin-like domain-containing protein [Candidatus Dojkabacteria bacterium]HRP36971.1 Gmad2 immunoglobulin-like domain-containing protein [Candidatus Dojkabacteria bacterium]HRP51155.1 Gmad2 immunoglobulin-like domain-containing protein [Candidatus Dojkabacteria bacterium]
MKKYLVFLVPLVFLAFVLIFLGLYYGYRQFSISKINSFEECVEWNFPILDIYPQQCMTPDGRTFVDTSVPPVSPEPLPTGEIKVFNPLPDQYIQSPLDINGEAPGTWFWEGSFRVVLTDLEGNEISSATITTTDGAEWMTEDFVPFEATLEFEGENLPDSGVLVFEKANPSGMPENNKVEEVYVSFKTVQVKDGCKIGGCSGQICSDDEDVITDCAYREEYACYINAECARQSNGECGWTMTQELQQCLLEKSE